MKDSNITFIAISIFNEQILFLKRNFPPICWGAPSGHLKIGELIEDAIKREMREEIGCECIPILPVSIWQGKHREQEVFNVTYVCKLTSNNIVLSEEHAEYQWVDKDRLYDFQDKTLLDLKQWPLFIELAELYWEKVSNE